jgi:hypothetical protein
MNYDWLLSGQRGFSDYDVCKVLVSRKGSGIMRETNYIQSCCPTFYMVPLKDNLRY